MIRRGVRGVGRTLVALGVLTLLFVVYQLYGTGFAHSRDQRALKSQFAARLAAGPPTSFTSTTAVAATSAPTKETLPEDCQGCVARIDIPKIGLDEVVVEGVGVEQLQRGVGHYPGTKMPGQPGNVAFAGHRTTYGHPFNRLDELEPGDPILVTTLTGMTYRYEMVDQKIVTPDHVEVLDDTADNRLTMTTCHPKLSAAQRMIVTARLVTPPAPVPPASPTDEPSRAAATRGLAGEDHVGLSGGAASRRPAIAWAVLAACAWLGAWAIGRWSGRRWTVYLLASPLFLVLLFLFFENFDRLLPANI